jgi:predicted branched-subunit amino acid permease
MSMVTQPESVRDGARRNLPFTAADFVDGVAFGAVAGGIGLGAVQATVMSATAFSATAQYAALTVLRDHGGVFAILVAVVALNARYLVFGASVARSLSRNPLRRAGEAQLLTDTSWALSVRDGAARRGILIGAGLSSLFAWTAGTAVGSWGGSTLADYRVVGLDAALPAFFLCLLLERLSARREAPRAVCAAVVAIALAPLVPAAVPIVVVLALALARRPG